MSLAQAISKRFGLEPRLTAGSRGVFDVLVDGKRIFCKDESGGFPDEDDLLDEIDDLQQA